MFTERSISRLLAAVKLALGARPDSRITTDPLERNMIKPKRIT